MLHLNLKQLKKNVSMKIVASKTQSQLGKDFLLLWPNLKKHFSLIYQIKHLKIIFTEKIIFIL